MQGWDIYLDDEWGELNLIDTVFYDSDCDKDYVLSGLIDHDGYDPGIKICKQDTYLTDDE